MSKSKTFLTLLIAGASFFSVGCNKEDDGYGSGNVGQTPATKLSNPTLDSNITTTTTSEVSFRCRFKNGGDTWQNMTCTVHWRQYSSKPSSAPKVSEMTKHETMRQYASTSVSTTFDKTHTGFKGGTYVYYYFECSNSKYKATSNVTYCVVKRGI